MPGKIEDYAVIGNCETMALVCHDGSIDWLGLPRFDSPPCFAALLGEPKHGRWLIAPRAKSATVTRQYRDSTMILETEFNTRTGRVRVSDFMTGSLHNAGIIRIVTGLEGKVIMRTEMVVRFDYGSIVPWVRRLDDGRLQMTAGPDRLLLDTDVDVRGENMKTVGEFTIHAREKKAFVLTWTPSFHELPERTDPYKSHKRIEKVWSRWAKTYKPRSKYSPAVLRSLLTLKALTHWETGGIVAAATTSLPEQLGGQRNWDYRYCWLRDATFTLYALIETVTSRRRKPGGVGWSGSGRESGRVADIVWRGRRAAGRGIRGAVVAWLSGRSAGAGRQRCVRSRYSSTSTEKYWTRFMSRAAPD